MYDRYKKEKERVNNVCYYKKLSHHKGQRKERETSKQKTLNKIAILRIYLSMINSNLNEFNI